MNSQNRRNFSPRNSPSPRNSRSPSPNPFNHRPDPKWLSTIKNMMNDDFIFYLTFLISSFFLGIVDPRLYIITIVCFIEFLRDNAKFVANIKKNLSISFDIFCLIFYVFLFINFFIPTVSASFFFFSYYVYKKKNVNKIVSIIFIIFGIMVSFTNVFLNIPISIFILKYMFRNQNEIISFIDSQDVISRIFK